MTYVVQNMIQDVGISGGEWYLCVCRKMRKKCIFLIRKGFKVCMSPCEGRNDGQEFKERRKE